MCAAVEAFHRQGRDWFNWKATTIYNPCLQEGLAWRLGRLDLRYRLIDTAISPRDHRAYNTYPPLQSIIGYICAWGTWSSSDIPSQESMPAYSLMPLLLFGLPIPVAAYWVFFRRTGHPAWAAVLAAALIGGTALLPCIVVSRRDDFHYVNHLLATTGLLILANEVLGRRRIWVMLLSLAIAGWSRQLTGLFALAVTYTIWLEGANPIFFAGRKLVRRSMWIGGLGVIIGLPMALNWAKFGSPFDSGYSYLFEGMDSRAAQNFKEHGLFSWHFLPTNAYYMNAALPFERNKNGHVIGKPSEDGGSLWFSTPLAAIVLFGVRWWWRDPAARSLMLCSVLIIAAHLFYHNTGYVQHGYYRFALDYLPVWLVVAAPWLCTGWRRWPTLAFTVWSLAYFALVRYWSGPNAI